MDALNNHGGFLVGPVIVNCESNDNVNCAFSEKFLLVSVTGRWTQTMLPLGFTAMLSQYL